jgi:small subunit ribosomal protein S4
MVAVQEAQATAERDIPDYVEFDVKAGSVKLTRIPTLTDVPYPVQMQPALVVEFYSR